jgi:hypothetical protein
MIGVSLSFGREASHKTGHMQKRNEQLPFDRPPALGFTRLHWRRAAVTALAMGSFFVLMGSGIIKCPTAKLFHVPCPACGSSRSMYALFSFDVPAIFRFNPWAPIVVAIVLGIVFRSLFLVLRDGNARKLDEERLGRVLLIALVVVVSLQIVHWALRFNGWFGGPCPV